MCVAKVITVAANALVRQAGDKQTTTVWLIKSGQESALVAPDDRV